MANRALMRCSFEIFSQRVDALELRRAYESLGVKNLISNN